MKHTPSVPLTPEDLGLNLEEDSAGVEDLDLSTVIETVDLDDLRAKIRVKVSALSPSRISNQLKRKGGILYCKVTCDENVSFFSIDWLRKLP